MPQSFLFKMIYLMIRTNNAGRMYNMIKSMTGFGRAFNDSGERSFTIEIKSVNHKFLDINMRAPKNIFSLEDRIRKTIQQYINRGKIDIFITQNINDKSDITAVFNESLCDSYVECLKKIKNKYNTKDDISLALLTKFPDVITVEQKKDDLEELWGNLRQPLIDAIDMLLKMRENEGKKLYENVILKCNSINDSVEIIESRSPIIIENYKNRLNEKLKDLLKDSGIDQNRVALEVAIFVDKSSIDEEIVRIKSHISQMKETLELNEPVGRKLDFIVQEMNRETNTIGSKTNDLDTVKVVLNIKNEIEKIREQIQNVE